ncbi:9282_t:CDS:1, partial [Cetraspora pellucida]
KSSKPMHTTKLGPIRSKTKLIKHLAKTREQDQNHMQETDTHSTDTPVGEPSAQTNDTSLVTESISSPVAGTSSDEKIREERSNKRQKKHKGERDRDKEATEEDQVP